MIKSIIYNIARLNLLRSWVHRHFSSFSDEECRNAFMEMMNVESQRMGMTIRWINPSGLGENGTYTQASTDELVKMGILASHIDTINDVWSRKSYTYLVRKPFVFPFNKIKIRTIQSTIPMSKIGAYHVEGGKTGSGDGYNTLLLITNRGGKRFVGVIMGAKNEDDRFVQMENALKFADFDQNGGMPNNVMATICEISDSTNEHVLLRHNGDQKSAPMSITKLMTILTALKYIKDMNQEVQIVPSDRPDNEWKGYSPRIWERVTIRDLMCEMLLSSSNTAANAMARIVGCEMLKSKTKTRQ